MQRRFTMSASSLTFPLDRVAMTSFFFSAYSPLELSGHPRVGSLVDSDILITYCYDCVPLSLCQHRTSSLLSSSPHAFPRVDHRSEESISSKISKNKISKQTRILTFCCMRLRPVELTSLCITSTLSGPSPPCDTLYLLQQNHIRSVCRTDGKR